MTASSSQAIREEFAERIRKSAGIRSEALVRALATVSRERFVGPGPWHIMRPAARALGYQWTPDDDPRHVYDTVAIALDASRRLNNGEPSGVVSWLDALDLAPGERVLHVGCGVGYYTAVVAEAVGGRGEVVAIELDAGLAERATRNLQPHPNVRVVCGDGTLPPAGPFDAVFVNAGCTRPSPAWLDQLAVGGRLLVPLTATGPVSGVGFMLLVGRQDAHYSARFISPVGIFDCVGARTDDGADRLAKAFARGDRHEVRRLRRDRHAADPTCWLHGQEFCLSLASA